MSEPEAASVAISSGSRVTTSRSARRQLLVVALLGVIAAGLLAPIWTVRYPPLVDYPNHLASAFVLAHLHDAAFQFGKYYQASWNTYPYVAMDALLLGLQHLMSIDLAGRLVLSLCVLSVPAAMWFFLHRANPGEESLAFWSLLVANNLYFLLYGFLNLQLSMALCFFLLGLWLWHLERPRAGTWCLLLLVATALYFCHVLGFAVAALVMTICLWGARRSIREAVSTWALFLPGALFYLHAVVGRGSPGALQFRSLPDKFGSLVSLVVGCSTVVDFLTLLVLLAVLAWAQIDNPDIHWNRPWRRASWILFLFYWLLPAAQGPATNIDKRLLPFVFLLSLAGAKVGRRRSKLAVVAVALFALRAGALERHALALWPDLRELTSSFSVIPRGARVLPLVDWADGAALPERHFWAYGVIERGWLTPCLFHDPGVHTLALHSGAYDPCGAALTQVGTLDWERVRDNFDFVWAYRVPQFAPNLSSIGHVVFHDDRLQVFRLGSGVAGTPVVLPPRN